MSYKICPVCGQKFGFDFTKSRLKRQTWCSASCRQRAKAKPEKKSTFTCEWCGNEFIEWTYRKPRFCSNQCRSEYAAHLPKPWQRRPENFVTIYCEQCNKEYVVHKCMTENGRNSRFCSAECRVAWLSENQVGKKHPKYTGGTKYPDRGRNWGKQRRRALKRDGHKCQICGKKGKGKKYTVDVHHIVPYKEFDGDYHQANKLTNLITLCRHCHNQVERHGLSCPRPLF